MSQEEQLKSILQKLDQMDTERNDSPLIAKVDQLIASVGEMKAQVGMIDGRSLETHNVLLGNGEPEKGLATRFKLLANQVETLNKKFTEHLEQHKTTSGRWWELGKPFIITLLMWIFSAAVLYGTFSSEIHQVIELIQSTH